MVRRLRGHISIANSVSKKPLDTDLTFTHLLPYANIIKVLFLPKMYKLGVNFFLSLGESRAQCSFLCISGAVQGYLNQSGDTKRKSILTT